MEVTITATNSMKAITQVNSTDILMVIKTMDITLTLISLTTAMIITTVLMDMVTVVTLDYLRNQLTWCWKCDLRLGYPGYGGYYGRPQGILGTVGTVLDGLLGLREGEKKQTTDGVVASAVDEPPAVVITDSAPAAQIASSPDGDGVIFQ